MKTYSLQDNWESNPFRNFIEFLNDDFGTLPKVEKNLFPSHFLADNVEKSILGLPTQELQNEELKYDSAIFQNISYTHFTELLFSAA